MAKMKTINWKDAPRAAGERSEISELRKRRYAYLYKAQYKKMFDISLETITKFPKNRFAQYDYAVALGDSEEWATPSQYRKNERKAAALFKLLLKKTRGVDPRSVRGWRNEYYWFSKQPLKQFRLGLTEVKKGDAYGNYSMGVGAVSLSLLYYKKSKTGLALRWAETAARAWRNYFKISPDYYNAHVWYAKSLGLSGDLKGMERALKKAAKLSKRPLSYREFVGARKEVLAALQGKKLKRK